MRTLVLAACIAAVFAIAAPTFAAADEFAGETKISEHHWGRGYHRGGGRRGGHRGDGYYYGGGNCW